MIKWTYHLTRQNWLVFELGFCYRFNWFWFQNLPSDLKRYRAFRETGPSWPGYWDQFRLGFISEISARVRVVARNSRNKADIAKHKNYNFRPYHSFGNATLKAVSCTAVKWDAYDAENTAGNARRCHSGHHNSSHFHPGNRAEVFIWQNFQPTYRDPGLKKCHLLRFPEEILCSN